MLTLARQAVTHAVVKVGGGLVVDRRTQKDVLILLGGIVGDVIERPGAGNAGCIHSVMERGANLRAACGLPSQIGRGSGYMEFVIGQVVCRLQPTEFSQVVQFIQRSGRL